MTSTGGGSHGKPWHKRIPWWGWVGTVAVLLVAGGIYDVVSPEDGAQDASPTVPATATVAPSEEPSDAPEASETPETPEASETPEPTEPSLSLAEMVWAQIEDGFLDGIVSDGSPLSRVTSIEDTSPTGTVQVYVSGTMSHDELREVARHVFTMGALNSPELERVYVDDEAGNLINLKRSDVF